MTSTPWSRLLGVVALLVAVAGCTSLKRVPLSPDPSYESNKLAGKSGLSIAGYSSPDGVFHAFQGKARWIGPARDSLELTGRREAAVPHAEPSGDLADKKTVTLRFARADITTLLYQAPDGGKAGLLGMGLVSTMLVAGVGAFVILYAVMGAD